MNPSSPFLVFLDNYIDSYHRLYKACNISLADLIPSIIESVMVSKVNKSLLKAAIPL